MITTENKGYKMIVYSYLPSKNYTKFDNAILRMHKDSLKDGAKVIDIDTLFKMRKDNIKATKKEME